MTVQVPNLALTLHETVHPQNVRFQNVRFQNVWFQNVRFQNVWFQNVQFLNLIYLLNKRIWIRFTCVSLFHYKISLHFFRFFSHIFASNFSFRFTWVIFVSKRNKAKRNSSLFFRFYSLIFTYFRYFSHFFTFSALFCFKFFASLRFCNFCFEAKQSEAKFKSIF